MRLAKKSIVYSNPAHPEVKEEYMLKLSSYQVNDRLAVILFPVMKHGDVRYVDSDCYDVASTNFDNSAFAFENEVFMDENNIPGIFDTFVNAGIATPSGNFYPSGYCVYRSVLLNMEAIQDYLVEEDV